MLHGSQRLGEELAGVRHPLRRGPAAVRGEPLQLCPPIPGADAQARGGPDRWAVSLDLDPAKDRWAEPAIDGRDDHRDQRLFARPVRPGRQGVLPSVRTAFGGPDSRPDRRPGDRVARRDLPDGPRPGDPRPEGGIQGPLRRAQPCRVRPRPGRWPGGHDLRGHPAPEADQARYRGRDRSDQARPVVAIEGGGGGRVGPEEGRRDGDPRRRGPARRPPVVEERLRPLRDRLRRPESPALQLQQPGRDVPRVRWPGRPS